MSEMLPAPEEPFNPDAITERLRFLEAEIQGMRRDFDDIKMLLGDIKEAAQPLLDKLENNPMIKMMLGG